jgi:hypothetical protein
MRVSKPRQSSKSLEHFPIQHPLRTKSFRLFSACSERILKKASLICGPKWVKSLSVFLKKLQQVFIDLNRWLTKVNFSSKQSMSTTLLLNKSLIISMAVNTLYLMVSWELLMLCLLVNKLLFVDLVMSVKDAQQPWKHADLA